MMFREALAKQYMKGVGLEIGPGDAPWCNPNAAHISYIDKAKRMDFGDISECLPNNFDFVCLSHVFEHFENPIKELKEIVRVTVKGGYILLVVPDRDYTFDKTRELTNWTHILRDYQEPGYMEKQRYTHLQDFCLNTCPPQRTEIIQDWGTHWHVWNRRTIEEHMQRMKKMLGFEIVSVNQEEMEIFICLSKAKAKDANSIR